MDMCKIKDIVNKGKNNAKRNVDKHGRAGGMPCCRY